MWDTREISSRSFESVFLIAYLLIAKLEGPGLGETSLHLFLNYISNRKQRAKIVSSFSDWSGVFVGIPQESILGPFLSNMFMNGLFLVVSKSYKANNR